MKIAFHIGVHGTDEGRLAKTLQMNGNALAKNGTEFVPPQKHEEIFPQTLMQLQGAPTTSEMEGLLFDSLLTTENPHRVIFSTSTFMGAVGRAVGPTGLYWQMARRAASLVNLFPSHDAEIFCAIRNPAALIPDILPYFRGRDYGALMGGQAPESLRWNVPARQLAQAMQGRRIVLWCHEDAPQIWPEIIRLVGDIDLETPVEGSMMYMDELLSLQNAQKLRETIGNQDRLSISGRRAICGRFLAEHAPAEAMEMEVDLPGWTQELIDQMSADYYRDIGEIAALPGVEFIMP